MKEHILPYRIGEPPKAIRRAKLDNIALVPASLLFRKEKYRTIANNLPRGGVLICQTEKRQRISHILARWQRGYRETAASSGSFRTPS
jgi:spermidine synthase